MVLRVNPSVGLFSRVMPRGRGGIVSHPRSLTLWKLLMKAPWGRHVHERAVSYYPDKALRIASDPPCLVDVDGDVVGRTPATFSVCPAAVEFYVKG